MRVVYRVELQQTFDLLGIQQDDGLPVGVASPRQPSDTVIAPSPRPPLLMLCGARAMENLIASGVR